MKQELYYRYHNYHEHQNRIGVGDITCYRDEILHHNDVDTLDYSLSLVVKGKLQFKDEAGDIHILKRGGVFQRIPGVIHSTCVIPTEEYREQFCLFSREVFYHLKSLNFIPDEMIFNIELTPELLCKLQNIKHSISSQSSDWLPTVLLDMQHWFLAIEQSRRTSQVTKASGLEMLAKEQLLQSWNEPLPVVAKRLNMSYTSFRKRFKELVGTTPGGFRKVNRIRQSCELLDLPSFSVTQVAEALEYPDVYCFSKQFKQVIGMTPSNYRQALLKQDVLPPKR
ncbi:helix-turn-helix transcriptional regulator [Vibrio mimicus]